MDDVTTDLRRAARAAAERHGVPADLFARQIQQESGFDPSAYNASSGATGIAQIVARYHPGVDPTDPIASLEYAAGWLAELHARHGSWRRALIAYNWGPGNLGAWDGQAASLPAETRRYLDVILGAGWPEPDAGSGFWVLGSGEGASRGTLRVTEDGVRLRAEPSTAAAIVRDLAAGTLVDARSEHAWRAVHHAGADGWIAATFLEPAPRTQNPAPRTRVFDPSTPTQYQRQDWTCAIRSTMWLLASVGIDVSAEEAQDRMAPRYVTPEVGLLDASGAGIVEVLREGWGVAAFDRATVTFDELLGWAGRCPLAIGGRAWGHWTAVRGIDADGRLVLANPARGPRYGQQTLDRAQLAALGPFSAVVIPIP